VLQGLFDSTCPPSSSYSYPSSPVLLSEPATLDNPRVDPPTRRSRRQKEHATKSTEQPSTTESMLASGSSFSYAPLPEDYSSPEPEYDYAAAQAYMNGDYNYSDSDQSSESPPTPPPVDFMGMGTPIINPRLLAKVLAAMAEGKPLYVEHSRSGKDKRTKEKREKKKKKAKDAEQLNSIRDGKDLGKKKASHKKELSSAARAPSNAPSAASTSTTNARSKSKNGTTATVGSKRRHSSAFGDELDSANGKKARPHGTPETSVTTSEPKAPKPKVKKGWKGWVEVEVTTSEDEDDEEIEAPSHAASSTKESKGKAKETQSSGPSRLKSVGTTEDGESDISSERVVQKKGWKGMLTWIVCLLPWARRTYSLFCFGYAGWALVGSPIDTSKLIKLDYTPPILTTRATRSGRTFGDEEFDSKLLRHRESSASGRPHKTEPAPSRS